MVERKDINLIFSSNQLPVTRVNKSIIALQKVASACLNTLAEWLGRMKYFSRAGGL